MSFSSFKEIVNSVVSEFQKGEGLFHIRKRVMEKRIFDVYLENLPAEINPIFAVNTVHDCNCCRDVMNVFGTMFRIDDNGVVTTVWDNVLERLGAADEEYLSVTKKLKEHVIKTIADCSVFVKPESGVGLFDVVSLFSAEERFFGKDDYVYTHVPFNPHLGGKEYSPHALAVIGRTYTFSHFVVSLDERWMSKRKDGKSTYGNFVGEMRDKTVKLLGDTELQGSFANVFSGATDEDSLHNIDETVCNRILELIDDQTTPLYRGVEYRPRIEQYISARKKIEETLKKFEEQYDYDTGTNPLDYWHRSHLLRVRLIAENRPVTRFHNSLIGLLAKEIKSFTAERIENATDEAGVITDEARAAAVKAAEKAAIANYTQAMANKGVTTREVRAGQSDSIINQLERDGYLESIVLRTHVAPSVIPSEAMVWTGATETTLSLAEKVRAKARMHLPSSNRVVGGEEISIDDFIKNVIPNAVSMRLNVQGLKEAQLCSLTGPGSPEPKQIFSHGNNYSLAFKGGTADYVSANVTAKGGDISTYFRVSLGWGKNGINLATDYDLHVWIGYPFTDDSRVAMKESDVYFRNPSLIRGFDVLDIDANRAGSKDEGIPVENMRFREQELELLKGKTLTFGVHAWMKSTNLPDPYDVLVAIGGKKFMVNCPSGNKHKDARLICSVRVNEDGTVTEPEWINEDLKVVDPEQAMSSGSWGLPASSFTPVSMLLKSPTHWDNEQGKGNLIWMFALPVCKATDELTSIFNEQLHPDLYPLRRGIQLLAETHKVPVADAQVSGIGFSSTLRELAVVEVVDQANVKRTYKVRF